MAYPDISAVDWFDTTDQVPTLSQLQAYDVVIQWTNSGWSYGAALGDVLADYVDAGGKVVVSTFDWQSGSWDLSGRFVTQQYSPLLSTGYGEGDHYAPAYLGTYNASNPIMQGVTSAYDVYRDYTSLTPGATLVASWDDGENLVATKACVVAINSYPGPYYQWGGYTSQMVTMYHNAVDCLMTSCGGGPTYDLSFLDDPGRSSLCINSTSGSYLWNILKGTGAGTGYTGTGKVTNTAALLSLISAAGNPQCINFYYRKTSKAAIGTFVSGRVVSSLFDSNTTNDPPCGGGVGR